MTDDLQRRGMCADLARRLALAPLDDLRLLDRVLTRLEQLRFRWERHISTSPHDVDPHFHLAGRICLAAVVTRCRGRWSADDATETHDSPPVLERCPACQRAAWSETELDPLIAAALEEMAADDLARKNLREAARAEMVGEGG